MADQTVEIDLSLQVEGPGGAQGPVRLADLQRADPAAGPGALEATQAAISASVDALLATLGGSIAVEVGNLPAEQPVSAAALPLPAGAATEATLAALLGRSPAVHADGGVPAHVTNLPAVQDVAGTVDVGNWPATVDVSSRVGRDLGHVTVDNPPNLAALSTSARQDAQTALLTTLAGVDFATGADAADLSAKLDAIAVNTAAIKLDADHLSIEADAINLNTDAVEARLDTLNAKDFATQATLAQLKARGDLLAAEATLAAMSAKLPAALVGGRLDVSIGASAVTLQTDPTDDAARLLGVVSVSNFPPTTGLTDAQLRAAPVPVETELAAAGPLSTEATLATLLADATFTGRVPAGLTVTGGGLQTRGMGVPGGDASGGVGYFAVGNSLYNGATWDRQRSFALYTSGAAVSDQGLMATGVALRVGAGTATALSAASLIADGTTLAGGAAVGNWLYNGATWDRMRGAPGVAGAVLVAQGAATSGGLSSHRRLSTASTNLVNVKGTPGQVYGWVLTNTTAAMKFVKLYNKATAPVIANDAGLILLTLAVPPTSTVALAPSQGIAFSAGIGFAVTGLVGDTDATATAANDVIVNLLYA